MGFMLAPHIEQSIARQNADRERFARFAQSWATDDRAISIAVRAGITGASLPVSAAPILAADGAPLTDDQLNAALQEGISYVEGTFNTVVAAKQRDQQAIAAKESTQDEDWDFRVNPKAFGDRGAPVVPASARRMARRGDAAGHGTGEGNHPCVHARG